MVMATVMATVTVKVTTTATATVKVTTTATVVVTVMITDMATKMRIEIYNLTCFALFACPPCSAGAMEIVYKIRAISTITARLIETVIDICKQGRLLSCM